MRRALFCGGFLWALKALLEPRVRKTDITGKPMKGWMVEPEGVKDDDDLET